LTKTIMLSARSGSIPDELLVVAKSEGISVEKLRERLATGRIIVLRNTKRDLIRIVGVGEGLSTKVNVNVGTSSSVVDIEMEKEKVRIAVKYGADSIMDLSIGGDIRRIRRIIMMEANDLPVGTVPTYQAYIEGVKRYGISIPEDFFVKIVEEHLKDGVDFMTIHAAITRDLAKKVLKSERIEKIVSRGGSLLAAWMLETDNENPFYKNWDYLLELFAEYDAVISLGDSLRPGALPDALDYFHIAELMNNARLVQVAREKGVQVMVEGPGHMPLDKIKVDIKLMKSLTNGAPYYVLGPLVTDIAAGYDHIAMAIGAAIAAAEGADFLCYLTPAEHLSLPTPEQVKEGLIAAKIAAHAGDIVKFGDKALKLDIEMSRSRAKLNWDKMLKLALDPEKAKSIHYQFGKKTPSCDMCGSLCAFLVLSRYEN